MTINILTKVLIALIEELPNIVVYTDLFRIFD